MDMLETISNPPRRVRKTDPKDNTAGSKIYTQYTPQYVDPQFKPECAPVNCVPNIDGPAVITSQSSLTSDGGSCLPNCDSVFSDINSSTYEFEQSPSILLEIEEDVQQHFPQISTQFVTSEEPYPCGLKLFDENCFNQGITESDCKQDALSDQHLSGYYSQSTVNLGVLSRRLTHPSPLVIFHDSESESTASFNLKTIASGPVRCCPIVFTPPESDEECMRYLSPPKQKGTLYLRHPIAKFNSDFQAACFILPYFDRVSNTDACLSAFKATIGVDVDNHKFNCRVSAIDGFNKSLEPANLLNEEADARIVKEFDISMDRREGHICKIDEGFESQVQIGSNSQDSNQIYYTFPHTGNHVLLQTSNGLSLENFDSTVLNTGGTVRNVSFLLDPSGPRIVDVESVNNVEPEVSTTGDNEISEVTNPLVINNSSPSLSSESTKRKRILTYCNSPISFETKSDGSSTGTDGGVKTQSVVQFSGISCVSKEVVIPLTIDQDKDLNVIHEQKVVEHRSIDVLNTPALLGSNHAQKRTVIQSSVNNNVSPKTNIHQIVDTVYVPYVHPNSQLHELSQQAPFSDRILRQQLEIKQVQTSTYIPSASVPCAVSTLQEDNPIFNGTSGHHIPITHTEYIVLPIPATSNNLSRATVICGKSSLNTAGVNSSSDVQVQSLVSTAIVSEDKTSAKSLSSRPRSLPGYVIVCRYCGMTSSDLHNCDRCKRQFPDDAKLQEDHYKRGTKHIPVVATTVGLGPNNSPIPTNPLANAKRTPGGGKKPKLPDSPAVKRLRGRKTEEIVLLSSDEEDDQPKAKIIKQDSDNCAKTSPSCSPKKLSSVGSEPLPPGITKHVQVNLVKLPSSPVSSSTSSVSIIQVTPPPSKRPQIMLNPGASLNCSSGDKEKPSFAGNTPEDVIQQLKDLTHISAGTGDFTCITYDQIRIGDYTWRPQNKDFIKVSMKGIYFVMPHAVNVDQMVDIGIPHDAVLNTVFHASPRLPCIMLQTGPKYAAWIRKALGLNSDSADGNYYSPVDGANCQKHIAIQNITNANSVTYGIFRKIFKSTINEPDFTQANEMVVNFKCHGHGVNSGSPMSPESTPSSVVTEPLTPMSQNGLRSGVETQTSLSQSITCTGSSGHSENLEYEDSMENPGVDISENKTIVSYQGITINQMDIMCLNPEQFLNDSILDSWMRYLEHEVLSPVDRSRTYMLSTFFYKCLTTTKKKRQGASEDENLSRAEKRHARVKRWTKKVDIFSKDFIFVPINENCHWFLAVICFPGLVGAHSIETGQPLPHYQKLKTDKHRFKYLVDNADASEANSNSQSSNSDSSTADSQSASSVPSDLNSTPKTGKANGKVESNVFGIKQPCIIIFDSLAGESRSRIFSTLREYLTVEYKTRKGEDRLFNKSTIPGIMPVVPQQPNHCDCGIFVLFYVQCFFSHPIKSFCQSWKKEMVQDWFDLRWEGMREEIYNVLKDFAIKENPDSINFIPKLNFPKPKKPKDKGKESIAEEKLTLEKVKPEDEPMDVDVEGDDSPTKVDRFTTTYQPLTFSSSSSQSSCDEALHDVNRTSDHDHDYIGTPDKRMRQM